MEKCERKSERELKEGGRYIERGGIGRREEKRREGNGVLSMLGAYG